MIKGIHAEIALLEAVRQSGSITAAAATLGVSYRTAWDQVRGLNNMFGEPLVDAKPGGKTGGGASLTAAGENVLAAFRIMQAEAERTMEKLRQSNFHSPLIWGLTMKTSARNLLQCQVIEIIEGAVNCEVALDAGSDDPLIAIVTQHSAEDLQLKAGSTVFALINPSFIILVREEEFSRSSARNCLRGEVVSREDGAVNSELVIGIGRSRTIAATITKESAEDLKLKVGDRVCALVKASHVVLLTPGSS